MVQKQLYDCPRVSEVTLKDMGKAEQYKTTTKLGPHLKQLKFHWPHYTMTVGNTIVYLTHWGQVMHICVGKLTIIDSDNGLSTRWRQAIIWINAGILSIRPLGTNFSHIVFKIQTSLFKNMHVKMSSEKCRPSCLILNVLTPSIALCNGVVWEYWCGEGRASYHTQLALCWGHDIQALWSWLSIYESYSIGAIKCN